MNRDGEYMVGDRALDLLVEVVADARSMREQVLDCDPVVDQRQVVAEQGTGGRGEVERPVMHEAHHGQGGEALGSARGPEPGVDGVRDLERAVCEAERLGEQYVVASIHADDS